MLSQGFWGNLHFGERSEMLEGRKLTFAGSDVVEVQLVALLGSLQSAFGGGEVARRVVGDIVGAANLQKDGKQWI